AEIADLGVDPVLLEDAGLDADIGRHEREGLRLRLAEADLDVGPGRAPERDESQRSPRSYPQKPAHRLLPVAALMLSPFPFSRVPRAAQAGISPQRRLRHRPG